MSEKGMGRQEIPGIRQDHRDRMAEQKEANEQLIKDLVFELEKLSALTQPEWKTNHLYDSEGVTESNHTADGRIRIDGRALGLGPDVLVHYKKQVFDSGTKRTIIFGYEMSHDVLTDYYQKPVLDMERGEITLVSEADKTKIEKAVAFHDRVLPSSVNRSIESMKSALETSKDFVSRPTFEAHPEESADARVDKVLKAVNAQIMMNHAADSSFNKVEFVDPNIDSQDMLRELRKDDTITTDDDGNVL